MSEEIEAQSQQEHSTTQSYQIPSVRGAGFYFGVLEETEETKNEQPQTRWYYKVGGWVCRRWQTFIRWLRRHSTLIIMLATLVNLLVAYLQWSTMIEETAANQKSAEAAEDQLAEMRNGSADTRTVAKATQINADTAQAALKTTIENARLDQRAWVGVMTSISPPLKVGEKMYFGAIITNSGKTPARKVNGQVTTQLVIKGYSPKLSHPKTPGYQSNTILSPGMRMSLANPDPDTVMEFDEKIVAGIQNRGLNVYIFGKVSYEDIFKQSHCFTFCYFLSPDLKMTYACETYNEETDTECPQ